VPTPAPEDKPPPAPPPGPPRYASPPSRRELMMFRIMFVAGGLFLVAAILIGVLVGSEPS
jgi:hypothetical protein